MRINLSFCLLFRENIEYISFEFNDFVNDLIKTQNFYLQNIIIFKFLRKNFLHKIKEVKIKNMEPTNIENEYSWPVKHICELKNEELLIIDINNNNNEEELYIYKKTEDYNFSEIYKSMIEEEITNLSELRNGNLLMLQKNKFKIFEIKKNESSIKLIQEELINDNDYTFKEIMELMNGYLVSLSINQNANNKIILWEKNLMNGKYENIKENIHQNAISMIAIDKDSFLILDSINHLFIYNSNKFIEESIGLLILRIIKNL